LSTSQFLATSLNPIDTDGASTLECDPGRVCPCEDSQIRPRQRVPVECNSRAFSPSVADAELIRADAVSGFAIEIGIVRQAELLSGVDPGPARRMIVAQYRNAQLSVRSAILTRLAIEAFELAEIREHVLVPPAGRSQRFPVVEALPLATDENQTVDRARATNDAAAWPDDTAASRAFRRFRREKS